MQQSKTHFHIGPRKVGSVKDYPVKSFKDVEALKALGVALDSADLSAMYQAFKGGAPLLAMDSNLTAPLSVASIGTPIQFLQAWLPGFVQVVTQARKIDELVGVTTIGRWEDEEVVQGYSERAGNAKPYNDQTTVPLTNWNTNWERRSIVRHESGFMVGRLEERRAAAMNYNSAENKRMESTLALDVIRNYIGFYGYNNGVGRTYGFLNEPSLPAYVNLPNGASGFSTWAKKTAQEIITDIITAMQQLRTQSGDLIDVKRAPITLAVATSVIENLSQVSSLVSNSVFDWLQKNYPNVRVESAPELNAANGGANVFYVYAEDFGDYSSDDGRVFIQMVPAKFMTLGAQQMTKGYEEDFGNATAGIMLKRPFAVVRYSGC